MCMIATGKYNNWSMRMNAVSIICDNNKGLKFKSFSEECFKLCSYANMQTVVKGGLYHKAKKGVTKLNRSNYHLQKNIMFNTWILRKICWFQEKY